MTRTSRQHLLAEWPSAHPGRCVRHLLPVGSSASWVRGLEWSVEGEVRPQAQATDLCGQVSTQLIMHSLICGSLLRPSW